MKIVFLIVGSSCDILLNQSFVHKPIFGFANKRNVLPVGGFGWRSKGNCLTLGCIIKCSSLSALVEMSSNRIQVEWGLHTPTQRFLEFPPKHNKTAVFDIKFPTVALFTVSTLVVEIPLKYE